MRATTQAWIRRQVRDAALRVAFATAALGPTICVASCTLASGIDVCERRGAAERDLNARTEGDQVLASRNAIGSLPSRGGMVVWTSSSSATASEVRGALVTADGALIPTCDSDAEHTFSLAGHVADEAVLATPRTEMEHGLIVYRRRTAMGHELWAVPITPSGCTLPVEPRSFALRVADPGVQILNPSVASLGASTFVVAWTEASPSSVRPHLFARRIGLPRVGLAPELLPTPNSATGDVADLVIVGAPLANGTLIPLPDGAAVAYFEPDVAAYRVWLARFDEGLTLRFAPVLVDQIAIPSGLAVDDVSISLAFDGAQFLVSWMGGNDRLEPVVESRFIGGAGEYLTAPREPTGVPFRLGTAAATSEAEVATIGLDGGGFLAAWRESGTLAHEDRSGRGVRAVGFDPNARVQFANRACDTTDFPLNLSFQEDQTLPALARLADDTVLAAWVTSGGDTQDRSGTGIRIVGLRPRDLFPLR